MRLSDSSIYCVVLTFVLLLTGCDSRPALRIGSNQWPGYEPVYLARDLDLLSSAEIKLVELPSATQVMQHIRVGNLDGGMLTLDEVLTLISEGVPMSVVLVLDRSNGADNVIGRQGIEGLEGLRGKRIGVEVSGVGVVMLDALLDSAGLSVDDVQVVPLTVDQHAEAFQDHQIDALVTFEPTSGHLLAQGGVELFSSRQIPDRIVDVLAVRREVAGGQDDRLSALGKAYFAARRFMHERPREALARMAPRLGIDVAGLTSAYQGMSLPDLAENHRWLNGGQPRLLTSARRLAKVLLDGGIIARKPDLDGLVDGRFLPAAP